jgi:uncharacterized protein (DUF2267 family)
MTHDASDEALALLRTIRERDGAEAAVRAAMLMIDVAAAWIAQEHGRDEARRHLRNTYDSQGNRSHDS